MLSEIKIGKWNLRRKTFKYVEKRLLDFALIAFCKYMYELGALNSEKSPALPKYISISTKLSIQYI
jgi:hypothetical protein